MVVVYVRVGVAIGVGRIAIGEDRPYSTRPDSPCVTRMSRTVPIWFNPYLRPGQIRPVTIHGANQVEGPFFKSYVIIYL